MIWSGDDNCLIVLSYNHTVDDNCLIVLSYYLVVDDICLIFLSYNLVGDDRCLIVLSYSRFAITRVIVLESSYLFLTEGMYTSGYITQERHKKFLKKLKKLCILIQIKSDLLELFYLAFYIGRFYEIRILFHILNDRNN